MTELAEVAILYIDDDDRCDSWMQNRGAGVKISSNDVGHRRIQQTGLVTVRWTIVTGKQMTEIFDK